MHETVTEIGSIRLTFPGIGITASILVCLLFALYRQYVLLKGDDRRLTAGSVMNSVGFGLLPAAAVLALFAYYVEGAVGKAVFLPLPEIPLLTEGGRFVPCRIEAAASIIAFAGICLWMMIRKKEVPENGDLLLTVLCVGGMILGISTSLRQGSGTVLAAVACALNILCLIIWTVRRNRKIKSPGRAFTDGSIAAVCTAAVIVTVNGVLSTGSEAGDFAVTAGCMVFLAATVLIAGAESNS